MMIQKVVLLSVWMLAERVSGFSTFHQPTRVLAPPSRVALQAKKKGKKAAKGFGKAATPPAAPTKEAEPSPFLSQPEESSSASFLQSVEGGGSGSIPTMEASSEPDLPAEERAKKLLREQYGLRTMQEQRMEDSIQETRKRLNELKAQADQEEEFIDIMAMLPAPLLKGIDAFLKLGVAVCTILFVSAGLGITVEAWSKASGTPLPENIDAFIVNIVEPNFTPGLLVLLGFSVSLGGFAALQISSASSQYKEE